jgi:hypothetical protein
MEIRMRLRSFAAAMLPLAATLLAGCDGATGNDGAFTMALSANTVAVTQGGSSTITLTFTRSDFDGPITLAAEGLPTGVTATFSPNPSSATSAILQLTASAASAPGSATVTIRATGDGPAEQTATLGVDIGVAGNFTLGALSSTLTVAQGGGDRTSVLVNRTGGFIGAVAIAMTGAPTGLTATLDAASTSGNSLSLSLAATASLAVGTYTLTATGSSAGVANQQATITVDVIAAPATTSLTMTFCSNSTPAFVAYKNEGAAWQVAAASGTSFTFNATDRLGVVTVYLSANQGNKQVNVSYGARSEFATFTGRDCTGSKGVTGTVAGLSAAQQARMSMGPLGVGATSSAPNYAFASLPDRVIDLVGTAGVATTTLFIPDKLILRRDLNPLPGAVLPVLDFAAAEAFVPQQSTLTIGTAPATDLKTVALTFMSANNTFGSLQLLETTSATPTIYGVPLAQQVAGDVHELYVDHFVQQSQTGRSLLSYYAGPGDRTEAVGPFVNAPTLTTLSTTPYLRMRARVDAQAEYPTAARILFYQEPAASDSRAVYLQVSSTYLGATPTAWDVAIPDLSGVAGFNNAWMPITGSPTLWTLWTFGGRAELLSDARAVPGDLLRYSDRAAVVVNGFSLRAGGGRAAFPRSQYFRR